MCGKNQIFSFTLFGESDGRFLPHSWKNQRIVGYYPVAIGTPKRVGAGLENMRRSFEATLERAKEKGQLQGDIDTRQLSDYLTAQVGALALMARRGASPEEMQDVTRIALGATCSAEDPSK